MKTFVIGDIHGAHRALVQVLGRANFDYQNDRLISIGDVVDGWPETAQCVSELLKIKHHIAIRGNHDMWCHDWLIHGITAPGWREQGGKATIASYIETGLLTDETHRNFFRQQRSYFVDESNRLFVHGGYDRTVKIEDQGERELLWNRGLYKELLWCYKNDEKPSRDVNEFTEVFIGHTQTPIDFPDLKPVNLFHVWNVDQGAKHRGKLTLMNVDTKEYWQSEVTNELYLGYWRERAKEKAND